MSHPKRIQQRLDFGMTVYFGLTRPQYMGYTRNLSRGGLSMRSKHLVEPPSRIVLELKHGAQPISLTGTVLRATEIPRPYHQVDRQYEYGIQLVEDNPEYLKMLEKLIREQSSKQRPPRLGLSFDVTFSTPEEVVKEYTHNISQGGMFIVCDSPPRLQSMVQVDLLVVDLARTIRVEGRVVHVIDRDTAAHFQMPPGFGIQFTSFSPGDKQAFEDYIRKLEGVTRKA
jgi:uncharacterized protein (TIGR02266 family)